ncbi:MAG: hypothetical protein WBA23_12440 [Tunicatimonas sp.]|uniref:hypothetical protein n=1 Tax=Tunicatimonas sp. TaxID=1940096 RepID=UPI003C721F5D
MNKIKFIKEKIHEIKRLNRHLYDYRFQPARKYLPLLDEAVVQWLSPAEIDAHAVDYPDYAEVLVPNQPAYYDGECYFPLSVLDTWMQETVQDLKNLDEHIAVENDPGVEEAVKEYIQYAYASQLHR